MWPPRLDHKGHRGSFLVFSSFLGHLCSGSLLPCGEDTQEAFGEVYMVRSWGLLPTTMWGSHLGNKSSNPTQAFRWQHSRQHPDPQIDPPSKTTPEFLTHRNYNRIYYCHFKPLTFGMICFAAIDNSCGKRKETSGGNTFPLVERLECQNASFHLNVLWGGNKCFHTWHEVEERSRKSFLWPRSRGKLSLPMSQAGDLPFSSAIVLN